MRIGKFGAGPIESQPPKEQTGVSNEATSRSELGLGDTLGSESPETLSFSGMDAFVTNYGENVDTGDTLESGSQERISAAMMALENNEGVHNVISTREDDPSHRLNAGIGEHSMETGETGWIQGPIIKTESDSQSEISIGRKSSTKPDKDDDD
jgi:hypothetical protein